MIRNIILLSSLLPLKITLMKQITPPALTALLLVSPFLNREARRDTERHFASQ